MLNALWEKGRLLDNWTVVAGWIALFIAAVAVYFPGLSGPFLLDDFGSIKPLGDYGGVNDWESFKAFVFGGNSGPTGRPLSLVSFLLDASNWPADARAFKRTNVVIHLVNGLMLGVVSFSVLRILDFGNREARWIALIASGLWLLHPFLVSTTLYVVQRMAQLSTLFMLAGLVGWLRFRIKLIDSPRLAYWGMSVSLVCFSVLATISKENGILLPLLVGVLEITVIASMTNRYGVLDRRWVGLFMIFPLVVISAYLGQKLFRPNFLEVAPPRDFSIYERLITQPRVLVDYLYHWFVPKLYTTGVFQDHFLKSTGLLSPITTALSAIFHTMLIVVAFVRRRSWPLFALAVLFFYCGHLLESTVVNLELYFEHRNYHAAVFLFLPTVAFGYRRLSTRGFWSAALVAIVLLGSFTRYSATVWQSLPSMIESSALKAPMSPRAQAQFAKLLFVAQQHERAKDVINRAVDVIPGEQPLLLTTRLFLLCNRNELDEESFEKDTDVLAGLPFDSRSLKSYNGFAQEVVSNHCPNIQPSMLESVFIRMLEEPGNGDPTSLEYSHINFLIGYSQVFADKPVAALEAFESSLRARPGASHAMAMAALLASNGHYEQSLVLADKALLQLGKERKQATRITSKVRESDILEFRKTVTSDLLMQRESDTSDRGE